MSEDLSAGRPKVVYGPIPSLQHILDRVCDVLKKHKQTGLLRDYVKNLSSLMLDIKNMFEEDKLFNFMSGLQSWCRLS